MGQFISWLLIIVGWVVVHYLSVVRERQKEIRERAEKLVQNIIVLKSTAIVFHTNPIFGHTNSRSLLFDVNEVARRLCQQPLVQLQIPSRLIVELRRSMTLENFEPSSFVQLDPESSQLARMESASEDLISNIEEAYAKRFLEHWWQAFRL